MSAPRWIGLAAAGCVLLACQDVVSVPGACPEFCPESAIDVRDTVLDVVLAVSVNPADTGYLSSVVPQGSFSGYVLPHEAQHMQVVGGGAPVPARGLMVFLGFSGRYAGGDTSVQDTIRSTDSLRFTFNILRRNTNVSGVTLALHEIPIDTDSSKTYADMDPYFQDSTLIGTLVVPDSVDSGVVSVTVLPGALHHFVADTLQSGIGLSIESPDPAFVRLGADTSAYIATVTRFVQVDSSTGTTLASRNEFRTLFFKTFVADTLGLPPPVGLRVGGMSGSRAFIKLNVPKQLVDSTVVVRASLMIPPAAPIAGAPGDTFTLRVLPLGTDFGPKSPLADPTYGGHTRVAVGSADTVIMDVTRAFLLWRGNAVVPHTVMLGVLGSDLGPLLSEESGSIDAFDLPDQTSAANRAILRITYGARYRPGR